jgi:microcystin degradation protein MlrC
MKILIATMSHETNTFSPVPTDLNRFGGGKVPLEGDAALAAIRGTHTAMGGLIEVAEQRGVEIVTGIAASAPPSGPVQDDAYEIMTNKISEAAKDCDGILLELHGAMVTDTFDDGEGTLLARLRRENPDIPIGVALDMHTNLYPEMVDHATCIAGFQTYPHVDMKETGLRAARVLLNSMEGKAKPTMAWGNVPMLPHVMRQGTDDEPNKSLQQRVKQMEQGEALIASLFTGFPHADIHSAGLSVCVVTDNDIEKAQTLVDELLHAAWQEREAFVYELEPLSESVMRAAGAAQKSGNGPVILLDHHDNTASGGTMDTTEVLAEILEQGLEDVAAYGIYDPEAVTEMIAAGEGAKVTVTLGAKFHIDAIPIQSKPLTVTGIVKHISNGRFIVEGPMSTGSRMNMGDSVVLDTGKVEIVVISRHIEPFDFGCFTSMGINPFSKTFLMLKSRIHYRATFMPMAKEIVECAGIGVCTSDYGELTFEKVRRPIYPLDDLQEPG